MSKLLLSLGAFLFLLFLSVPPANAQTLSVDPSSFSTGLACGLTSLTATLLDQGNQPITSDVTYAWSVNPGTLGVLENVSGNRADFRGQDFGSGTVSVIATYFSEVTFSASASFAVSGSCSSGGSAGLSAASADSAGAPMCTAQKPGSTPKLLTVKSSKSGEATLTWEKAKEPVTSYLISYGLKPGVAIYGVPDTNSLGTTFTVKALKPSTVYYFRIKAKNGCAVSDFSNEVALNSCTGKRDYVWFVDVPTPTPARIATQSVAGGPTPTPTIMGDKISTAGFPWFWLFLILALIVAWFVWKKWQSNQK